MSRSRVTPSSPQRLWLAALCLALLGVLCAHPAAWADHGPGDWQRPQSITVVCDDNYPPYIFRSDEGQVQGIVVDLWQAWEKATGVRVDLKAMDWGLAKQTMREGRADVIDTIFYNEERAKLYDFTKPYASLDVPVFVHKTLGGISDAQSLRGFSVGVKAGDAVIDVLRRYGIHSFKEYDSYKDIINAARTGDIRVFSIDAPPAHYYLYKYDLEGEFRQAFVLYSGQFHRAVRKGDSGLLGLVELGFAAIPAAERRAIEEKWLGVPLATRANMRQLFAVAGSVAALALALAVFTLVLRRQVRTRTSELAGTLSRLRESEERFRAIYNSVNDFIFLHDTRDLSILGANQSACDAYGYAKEELIRLGVQAISAGFTPYTQHEAERYMALAIAGEPQRFEWLAKAKDGRLFWVEISMQLARLGDREQLLSSARDIDERKRAVEALQASEDTLRSLFASMTDVIFIINAEGRYLEIAPTNTDRLYLPPVELLGRTVSDVFPPEQAEYFLSVIRQALEGGSTVSTDYHMRIGDKTVWFAGNVSPLAADRVLWVARDITERKKAEEALLESRERLQLALDAANDGLWDWRLTTGEAYFSPRYYTMLGYEPGELEANYENFAKLLHPDDFAAIDRAVHHELHESETNSFEIRMRTKSGEWKWILTRSRVVDRDATGAPARLAGTHTDITERKRAEEALRESEAQLRTLINAMPDIVCFKDGQGRWIEANDFDLNLFELENVDYRGKTDCELAAYSDYYREAFLSCEQSDEVAWQHGGPSRGDEVIPRPDGSWRTFDIIKVPTFDENGGRKGLIVVGRDITERKRAEEALQANEALFRRFSRLGSDWFHACVRREADSYGFTWVGGAVEKVTGYTVEEMAQAKCFLHFVHPEDAPALGARLHFMRPGDVIKSEFRFLCKDGGSRWVSEAACCEQGDSPDELRLFGTIKDITERKQAEEALASKDALLRAMLRNLPFDFWARDRDQRIIMQSDESVRLWGDLQGNQKAERQIDPDNRAAWEQTNERVLAGEVVSGDREFVTLSGERRTFHDIVAPIRDGDTVLGILGVNIDITERKLAVEALRESEERYRTLFEQSLDAIAIQEGKAPVFTWVNQAFCKLFGYAAEEIYAMRSQDIWQLVHPDDRELVRASLTDRMAGNVEEVRYAFRILRKDGSARWVDVSGRRMTQSGRPMNLSIYRDTTERKMYEEALTQARDAADAASRAKSEFLANMSHEIRTPLNGIVGMIQLLDNAALDEQEQRYVTAALQSSQRLTRLLGDILDISRIEAKKFVVDRKPFLLAEIMDSVETLFRLPAGQKGVALSLRLDPDIPKWLMGDEHRLRQVLFNLVGNAVKFTVSGEISVEAQGLAPQPGGRPRVLFVVSDTGVGIPLEMIDLSFQMFTQLEGSLSRRHQGAGLGLAIVRHLVALMGGPGIDVSSEVGQGTTFSFVLPFGEPEAGAVAETARLEIPADAASLKGLRVLLVEDEEINQLALRTGLERRGLKVTCANDGEAALEALRTQDFDCVLTDIQMPGMNGLELTQAIRTRPEFAHCKDTPVVALTAFAMTGDRERFLAAGMDDYLAKPFSFEELERLLARIRQRRAAAKADTGAGEGR